ncbi:MAG TPA: hypothetical protein PLV04_00330 [Phenylobacterium sp.]|jgi:hypothetical protein|uniref:Uncharacterized protein n=1 Tax=Phenylobacterium conjunctum TaxID=1298959 RepID=A0ABW3T645_9CAUL|nr:hypothetical protein [Phenylobacterium sp.]
MFWNRHRTAAAGPRFSTPPVDLEREVRAAYERGRRDERAARKRHPVLMALTFAAAALGAVVLGFAVKEGSFERSGDVVDQGLAAAADRAEPTVRDAAGGAGAALRGLTEAPKAEPAS